HAQFTLRVGDVRSQSGWRVRGRTAPGTPPDYGSLGGPSHDSSSAGADGNRSGRAGISGRGLWPRRPVQRRTGRRGDISADDSDGVHPGEAGCLSDARTARSTQWEGAVLRGELAVYSASHDFENGTG